MFLKNSKLPNIILNLILFKNYYPEVAVNVNVKKRLPYYDFIFLANNYELDGNNPGATFSNSL